MADWPPRPHGCVRCPRARPTPTALSPPARQLALIAAGPNASATPVRGVPTPPSAGALGPPALIRRRSWNGARTRAPQVGRAGVRRRFRSGANEAQRPRARHPRSCVVRAQPCETRPLSRTRVPPPLLTPRVQCGGTSEDRRKLRPQHQRGVKISARDVWCLFSPFARPFRGGWWWFGACRRNGSVVCGSRRSKLLWTVYTARFATRAASRRRGCTPRREQVQVRARDGRDGAMDAVGEGARPCAVFFVAGLTAWVRARSKILRRCGTAADAIAKYELGPPLRGSRLTSQQIQ